MPIVDRMIPYSVSGLLLNQARIDFALGMTKRANTITVLTSHADGTASFKVNSTLNQAIPAEKGLQINVNGVDEIYLTNLSSAGIFKVFTSYVY